jgi:hypothetical protein
MPLEDLMPSSIPYVSRRGTVVLSDNCVADGYRPGYKTRIQSHVHDDHMRDFMRSKSSQEILCSTATRELLIAEMQGDLPIRGNLRAVEKTVISNESIDLIPAHHMLGSVQVVVESPKYGKVGYSGDIGWPVAEIPRLDKLVIDATYGSPQSKKLPSRAEMIESASEIMKTELELGAIVITGFRGAIHRVASELMELLDAPILCSDRRKRELEVFSKFGYKLDRAVSESDSDYNDILNSGRYVMLVGKGDELHERVDQRLAYFNLSARIGSHQSPITKLGMHRYSIVYSDHADFSNTVEYVLATGAEFVLTDSFRSSSASKLAIFLESEIGIVSRASTPDPLDMY